MKNIIKSRRNILILIVVLLVVGFFVWRNFNKSTNVTTYQTEKAAKGSLIMSVTASGQVSSTNNTSITTQASGVVTNVYVKNGDEVKVGDKIAELELDLDGNLRSTQAWASYQSAQNSLDSAKANLYTMQSSLFTNWKTYMDIAQNSTYQNSDGTPNNSQRQEAQFMSKDDDWLAAEAKYKNQQNVVNQAQTSVNSAWLNYQQSSPVVYAPISGTVTGLSLQEGTVLLAQSNSSGNATSQKIASIKTNAAAQINVSLSEIDVTKVKVGNKATITLDAFSGKTFTGKVISIDTIGSISSGVTTYPAVISLDTNTPEILPNMSVTAKIITGIINDTVLVPSAAVQTANGESTVRVLKNGQPSQVSVEVKGVNDTEVAISKGLKEGDEVVTNTVTGSGTSGTKSSSSPFSSFGGGGGVRGLSTGR